jgi:hypothetical protein
MREVCDMVLKIMTAAAYAAVLGFVFFGGNEDRTVVAEATQTNSDVPAARLQ